MISGIQNTSAASAQLTNQSQGSSNKATSQGRGEKYLEKARSKGIPEAVIQQGKQAAMKWLVENKQTTATAENPTEGTSNPQKETNEKSETLLNTFV